MSTAVVRGSMALIAALSWCALIAPGYSQDRETDARAAIVSTEIKNSTLGRAEPPVAHMMDQVIVSLFHRGGYQTRVVQNPSSDWLADQQLAEMGRSAEARWVIYPKILVLGSAPPVPGRIARGTQAILYVRIVDATAERFPNTAYMRQVSHGWATPPTRVMEFGEVDSLPLGVVQVFEYFQPLNNRLVARGLPTLVAAPRRVAQAIWPAERVAGFRETIRDP